MPSGRYPFNAPLAGRVNADSILQGVAHLFVTTAAQTFTGNKTFTGAVTIAGALNLTGDLEVGGDATSAYISINKGADSTTESKLRFQRSDATTFYLGEVVGSPADCRWMTVGDEGVKLASTGAVDFTQDVDIFGNLNIQGTTNVLSMDSQGAGSTSMIAFQDDTLEDFKIVHDHDADTLFIGTDENNGLTFASDGDATFNSNVFFQGDLTVGTTNQAAHNGITLNADGNLYHTYVKFQQDGAAAFNLIHFTNTDVMQWYPDGQASITMDTTGNLTFERTVTHQGASNSLVFDAEGAGSTSTIEFQDDTTQDFRIVHDHDADTLFIGENGGLGVTFSNAGKATFNGAVQNNASVTHKGVANSLVFNAEGAGSTSTIEFQDDTTQDFRIKHDHDADTLFIGENDGKGLTLTNTGNASFSKTVSIYDSTTESTVNVGSSTGSTSSRAYLFAPTTGFATLYFSETSSNIWWMRMDASAASNPLHIRDIASGVNQMTFTQSANIKTNVGLDITGNVSATGTATVGNATSSANMYINAIGTSTANLNFQEGGSTKWRIYQDNNASNNPLYIRDQTNTTNYMCFEQTVGICVLKTMAFEGAANVLNFDSQGAGSTSTIEFQDDAQPDFRIKHDHDADTLFIGENGGEGMTVDASGNVTFSQNVTVTGDMVTNISCAKPSDDALINESIDVGDARCGVLSLNCTNGSTSSHTIITSAITGTDNELIFITPYVGTYIATDVRFAIEGGSTTATPSGRFVIKTFGTVNDNIKCAFHIVSHGTPVTDDVWS